MARLPGRAAVRLVAFGPGAGLVQRRAVAVGERDVRGEGAFLKGDAEAARGAFALAGKGSELVAFAHAGPDGGRLAPAEPAGAFEGDLEGGAVNGAEQVVQLARFAMAEFAIEAEGDVEVFLRPPAGAG